MAMKIRTFENTEGKGENAGDQHFLFFPQCFSALPITSQIVSLMFKFAFNLDKSKILLCVRESKLTK